MKFITCCPDDTYYTWQVHLWLESLRKLEKSKDAIVLIFIPSYRTQNAKWQTIIDLYPESEFKFYKDETNEVTPKLGVYIPVLRPYCMAKYLISNPIEEPIFYCDSDILFTDKFNVEHLLNDDINYLSDTNSYINADYFDSKEKDVLPHKLEEYKKRDILQEATSLVGITPEICRNNNLNSGGAQYLLKNTNYLIWEKILKDCLLLRTYFLMINKEFFESENKGFQSWCADMWAVLWGIWSRGQETKVVEAMSFAWAPDPISRLQTTTIYHNAGITSDNMGYPTFYKGKYHLGSNPLEDSHLQDVINDPESKKHCNHFYASALVELGEKYGVQY